MFPLIYGSLNRCSYQIKRNYLSVTEWNLYIIFFLAERILSRLKQGRTSNWCKTCLKEQEHCCWKYNGGNFIQRRISEINKQLSHFKGLPMELNLTKVYKGRKKKAKCLLFKWRLLTSHNLKYNLIPKYFCFSLHSSISKFKLEKISLRWVKVYCIEIRHKQDFQRKFETNQNKILKAFWNKLKHGDEAWHSQYDHDDIFSVRTTFEWIQSKQMKAVPKENIRWQCSGICCVFCYSIFPRVNDSNICFLQNCFDNITGKKISKRIAVKILNR